jgi:hypothetical protein
VQFITPTPFFPPQPVRDAEGAETGKFKVTGGGRGVSRNKRVRVNFYNLVSIQQVRPPPLWQL